MKKLICAAALATSFAALADVSSANIVGYSNTNLVKSVLQNTGVCFMNVDGTDIDIQDIIPMNNGSTSGLDGLFSMRWFDGGKYTYAYYYDPLYDPESEGGEGELPYGGWSNDEVDMFPFVGGKTFLPGEGFLVKPDSSVANPKLAFPNPLYSDK